MPSHSLPVQESSNEQDTLLIQRILENDSAALTQLLTLYARSLGAIAFSILGSNDLAQDAVQDVFIRLWQERHTIEIRIHVRAYLYRAVRNRALDLARAQRRATQREQQWWQGWNAESSASYGGETEYDASALRDMVYRALEGVPPRCREIFLMSWEAGLTYAEIAGLLGIGLPTIYNQMSRATSHLAAYFRERGWP